MKMQFSVRMRCNIIKDGKEAEWDAMILEYYTGNSWQECCDQYLAYEFNLPDLKIENIKSQMDYGFQLIDFDTEPKLIDRDCSLKEVIMRITMGIWEINENESEVSFSDDLEEQIMEYINT